MLDWVAAHPKVTGGQPVFWRWHPERDDLDLAASLQPYGLTDQERAELCLELRSKFTALERVSFEAGFLNLRFASNAWAGFLDEWCGSAEAFLELLKLPIEGHTAVPQWPYRWLLIIHEAQVLASLEGWNASNFLEYRPSGETLSMLKQVLALRGLLPSAGAHPQRRTMMMQTLVHVLQGLWKAPILTPVDPEGSHFRQGILRLVLLAAHAIGRPMEQLPKDAIGKEFDPSLVTVE